MKIFGPYICSIGGFYLQSKPQAIALAGAGGVAQAAPVATAVVGKEGLAIAAPSATAIAGKLPFKTFPKINVAVHSYLSFHMPLNS